MDEIKLDTYRERTSKPTIIAIAVMVFIGALTFAITSIYDAILSTGYTSTIVNPALAITIHGMVFDALTLVLFVAFVALILYWIVSYFLKREFWGYLTILTFLIFLAVFVFLSFARSAADAFYLLTLPPGDQWVIRYMDGPIIVYETLAVRSAAINLIICLMTVATIVLVVWNYLHERKIRDAYKDVTTDVGGKRCVVVEKEKICWMEEKDQ